MDGLFDIVSLDTLGLSEKASDRLTSTVNNILTGVFSLMTREDILGFCNMLLLGDEKTSATEQKNLAYVVKTMTKEHPPAWKVVVTVVKVTENLKAVLKYHTMMFQQLTIIQDPISILSACCNMLISDPRKYTQVELGALLDKSNITEFTYQRKSAGREPSPKRVKTTAEDIFPLFYQPICGDALEGANLLEDIKTSPLRLQQHATVSPKCCEVPTGASVTSVASDVLPMTRTGISKASRMLEAFFKPVD